jgi:hypothetical protein
MHRVYGTLRLPLLLRNWTILAAFPAGAGQGEAGEAGGGLWARVLRQKADALGHWQPVFVLENTVPDTADVLQRVYAL